jgi:hypothetical protein
MKAYIIILIPTLLIASLAAASADSLLGEERISNDSGASTGFSKIYVDGFGVNSSGFKLILRTYERHSETQFQPFLVDIEYILMAQGKVIHSERDEQIPLPAEIEGTTLLNHHAHVALEEGRNYTGIAKVYLYNQGVPEYFLTVSSNFTARNDAEITDVFGDGIGASATIKSKSMVPLNASIIFTLKQDGRIIETREAAAPYIMANDKEKTINVLWNDSLNEGAYMVSVLLKGNDVTVNHDKVFTVEKRIITAAPNNTAQQGSSDRSVPGFTSVLAVLAIFVLLNKRRS